MVVGADSYLCVDINVFSVNTVVIESGYGFPEEFIVLPSFLIIFISVQLPISKLLS